MDIRRDDDIQDCTYCTRSTGRCRSRLAANELRQQKNAAFKAQQQSTYGIELAVLLEKEEAEVAEINQQCDLVCAQKIKLASFFHVPST